jgi:hypothetical protein
MMMDEETYNWMAEVLTCNDARRKAIALKIIMEQPSADPRQLPYIEALLDDRTPCIICIPYHYAEVRWMAAQALAAVRQACGIEERVRVEGVVLPLNTDELSQAASNSGLRPPGTELVDCLPILRDAGLLTVVDLDLSGAGSLIPWKTTRLPTGGYAPSAKRR